MAPRFTCNSVNQTKYVFALMLFFSFFCTAQQHETQEQKALRNGNQNIDTLYLELLFCKENRQFLETQMRYMGDIFAKEKLGLEHFQPYSPDRRNTLVRLVLSSFTAREQDSPNAGFHSHILEAHRQKIREPEDITKWYEVRGTVLNGLTADDWNQSLTELVEKAVASTLLRYSETLIDKNDDLAVQLAFILLQTHELYWRGRGMRLLGNKVDQLSSTHDSTPSFHLFLQYLTNRFQNEPTLWHSSLKTRQHQKHLANVFTLRFTFRTTVGSPQIINFNSFHSSLTDDFPTFFATMTIGAGIGFYVTLILRKLFSFIEEKQKMQEPKPVKRQEEHEAKANSPDHKQPGIDNIRKPETSSGASLLHDNEELVITDNPQKQSKPQEFFFYDTSVYSGDHLTSNSPEPSASLWGSGGGQSDDWCSAPSSHEVNNRQATFT